MKNIFFISYLFLLWADSAVNAQNCTDSFRIVILGSSTAAGAGASPGKSWANRFTDSMKKINPGNVVYNLAVGGTTTYAAQPDNYIPPAGRPAPLIGHNITEAINLQADAVIINYPSNDAAHSYSLREQKSNFRRISKKAAKHDIVVWVATPQPRNNFNASQVLRQKKLYNWIHNYYQEKAIDFHEGLASAKDSILFQYNSGDGIHLNNAGHGILYERVIAENIPAYLYTFQPARLIASRRSLPAKTF